MMPPSDSSTNRAPALVSPVTNIVTPSSVSPSPSVLCQNTLSNLQPFMSGSSHAGGGVASFPNSQQARAQQQTSMDRDRWIMRKMARHAYNMAGYLMQHLKMHSLVLPTAMVYYHTVATQIGVSGVHEVNEVVLICACVLLASKVEHSRVRLTKLIVACFEIDLPEVSGKAAEVYNQYKRMVLGAEMVVCSLLDFEFHRHLPYPRLEAVLKQPGQQASASPPQPASTAATTSAGNSASQRPRPNTSSKGVAPQNGGGGGLYHEIYNHCSALHVCLLQSPFIASLMPDVLADALVSIALKYLQCEDEEEVLLKSLKNTTSDITKQVEEELLEVLSEAGSALTRIDQLNRIVKERKIKVAEKKRSRSAD